MAEEKQDGFFRRIFEGSPAAIIVVAPDFQISDANLAAERMFGRGLQQHRDTQLSQFVAHSDQAAFAGIRTDIENQDGCVARPLLLRLPDETECDVSLNAAVIRDEGGGTQFILVTLVERGKSISQDLL